MISPKSSLPKWICYAVNGTQRERDLHDAIVIAWQALEQEVLAEQSLQSTKDALRHIKELGQ